MTIHVHPSSSELLAAIHEPDRVPLVVEHVGDCLACRVRLSRLREAAEPEPTGEGTFQRIMAASTPLPDVITGLVTVGTNERPQPNQVWRIGRDEALLAWVRRIFDDGVAEVVPLVLDNELADQHSVLIRADATPVGTEMAAIVAVRTHIHVGAFLNRIGELDISREVAEILTAVKEGRRPSGIPVGPPIEDDDDQRLEYRQALRDLLARLSPSAWLDDEADPESSSHEAPAANLTESYAGGLDSIKEQLSERLRGIHIADSLPVTVAVGSLAHATRILNVTYLDATVIVVQLHVDDEDPAEPDNASLAQACASFLEGEPGADAVAVAVRQEGWPTRLFPSSYLRTAHLLPTGVITGPEPSLSGLGLVDILCKHLDGTSRAWELLDEPARSKIGTKSIRQVAVGHAASSIEKITKDGKRALQVAKKTAWQSLPDDLDQQVANFVAAVARNGVEEAMADLLGELSGD
ncbi:hypothetical protein [Paractinoplanes rishiriensis]|uniref:Uncharacterized protein n=1 Tax=Paractinoplanes rishiriensis TaxID=1050105 RepID=A0A919KBQ2_9ACTN|nr:hypothetical protein [Actinoplanes rishiriensis]GIF02289.1 hypothetical protein Ari01nite_97530 [Actinoplanes rishiriensis]